MIGVILYERKDFELNDVKWVVQFYFLMQQWWFIFMLPWC